jgi:hypothetical protein
MNLLMIVVVVSWLWMMTTALHLGDARIENARSSPLLGARRRPR